MKVIQYLATSVNGHITVGNDGTDWVTQKTIEDFGKLNFDCGVVVMGKRTFESFGNDFPQPDCLNIVMTHDSKLLEKEVAGALFTDKSVDEIVKIAVDKGFSKLFVVGGSKTNTAFLRKNLIDEIWINIHPLLIGHGKYLFEEISELDIMKLEMFESQPFDGDQILLKYRVNK